MPPINPDKSFEFVEAREQFKKATEQSQAVQEKLAEAQRAYDQSLRELIGKRIHVARAIIYDHPGKFPNRSHISDEILVIDWAGLVNSHSGSLRPYAHIDHDSRTSRGVWLDTTDYTVLEDEAQQAI